MMLSKKFTCSWNRYLTWLSILFTFCSPASNAQNIKNNPSSNHGNRFEQLGTILPDANTYRTASGAPGHQYWQQKADYQIKAILLEKELVLQGEEWITYTNNSPDVLSYIWLQLDENQHNPEVTSANYSESEIREPITEGQLNELEYKNRLAGYGVQINEVKDSLGNAIPYTIQQTMMRVDLPKSIAPKQRIKFYIAWHYKIPERNKIGGRGGFEFFKEDGNHIFTISQWFPRMCVYSDYQGWNHKQFTGKSEFALVFGNYDVQMTVPADHIVCATGTCVNNKEILSPTQFTRWQQSQKSDVPIEIVTLEEAKRKEKNKDSLQTKTWHYKASNVRDFAWGSSRKFVWDAMQIQIDSKPIMCMSYYGKEAYGLYRPYSTKTVAHTIRTYSKYTISYPYPVAISVEASSGMEYPMICFNYGRTDEDGTYSARTKYGMISVIIHEVGHNFFPMIINSDERQWTWMDEGLNTFVQFLTEQEFDNNYPSSRGPAHKIVDYMKMPKNQLEPIMTNYENVIHSGSNAYAKTATGLTILRETIMGRKQFDFAFKEYAKRWAFKHPSPADFFRTMEDASSIDLDWFWRGWFYDIEPVDISLDSVQAYTVKANQQIPIKIDTIKASKNKIDDFEFISKKRNRESGLTFLVEKDTSLRDFYYFHPFESDSIKEEIKNKYSNLQGVSEEEVKKFENKFYYALHLSNKGGMVMPIIVQWNYKDGTSETETIDAYIWRRDERRVTKNFMKEKEVASIVIDPLKETADIQTENNRWPSVVEPSRLDVFKQKEKSKKEKEEMTPMKKALQKG
jgi:hypothetical protein